MNDHWRRLIINENLVRSSLMILRQRLDSWHQSATLPNRDEELFWLIAERFFPELIDELFPDWVSKPAAASFCLERQARHN